MTGTRRGGQKAVAGGALGERVARRVVSRHVDGTKRKHAPTVLGRVDGGPVGYKGKPLEVKSCRVKIRDGSGRRAGRFWFSRAQHAALVKQDGYYAFVARQDGDPENSRVAVVRARDVPAGDGREAWTVSHHRLVNPETAMRGRARPRPKAPWWQAILARLRW